ncbi:hypothetical protein [Nostoc sp.]
MISSAVKHKSIAIAPWQSQTFPTSLLSFGDAINRRLYKCFGLI